MSLQNPKMLFCYEPDGTRKYEGHVPFVGTRDAPVVTIIHVSN